MASLEERVSAIEDRLGMEAGLRGTGDRDLAEVAATSRAPRHLIQALSITQSEHTETLERQSAALNRLEDGVGRILTLLERLQP